MLAASLLPPAGVSVWRGGLFARVLLHCCSTVCLRLREPLPLAHNEACEWGAKGGRGDHIPPVALSTTSYARVQVGTHHINVLGDFFYNPTTASSETIDLWCDFGTGAEYAEVLRLRMGCLNEGPSKMYREMCVLSKESSEEVVIQRPFIALLLNAAPLYGGRCILITLLSPLPPSDSPPFVPLTIRSC
ncbi:hypothetical protein EDB86DRAFT_1984674 [Lactarius hatsudake]|nr:hypothetical protein EDB86DRAFT_1984674 [Lactarius hatsudake]